jgi:hypothetical protein
MRALLAVSRDAVICVLSFRVEVRMLEICGGSIEVPGSAFPQLDLVCLNVVSCRE